MGSQGKESLAQADKLVSKLSVSPRGDDLQLAKLFSPHPNLGACLGVRDRRRISGELLSARPGLCALHAANRCGVDAFDTLIEDALRDGSSVPTRLSASLVPLFRSDDPDLRLLAVRCLSDLILACYDYHGVESASFLVLLRVLSDLTRQGEAEAFRLLNYVSLLDDDLLRKFYRRCLTLFVRGGGSDGRRGSNHFGMLVELMVPFEEEEVTEVLEKSLSSAKSVHGKSLGLTAAVFAACYGKNGEKHLKGMISDSIVKSLCDWDEPLFHRSLSFAQLAASCSCSSSSGGGGGGRSLYGEWFCAAFGQEGSSLVVRAGRRFGPFIQMLTAMVAGDGSASFGGGGEEGAMLTAHVATANRPFLPAAHKAAWEEYRALARRKLSEMGLRGKGNSATILAAAGGIIGGKRGAKKREGDVAGDAKRPKLLEEQCGTEAENLVREIIREYMSERKIPQRVFLMSACRPSFFSGRFVPKLAAFEGEPKMKEASRRLLNKLKKKGIVSNSVA